MLDPSLSRIPSNVAVLMVVHPAGLSAAQLYAIDQFVLGGGRALIFVDPNSELAQAGGGMDPRAGGAPMSDLPKLFQAWGVGYNPGKVVADKALAQRVQVSSDPRNPVASYPIWLHLTASQFDSKDTITANLQSMNLASAGALHPLKGATTHFTPLVSSVHRGCPARQRGSAFQSPAAGFDGPDPADAAKPSSSRPAFPAPPRRPSPLAHRRR